MKKVNQQFIKGLDLAQGYYRDLVAPILLKHYSRLPYAACLIGEGSDVLGFDTEISCDHDWGPRLMIFVESVDISLKDALLDSLQQQLPQTYQGYPTGFLNDNGVHLMDHEQSNSSTPRITVQTIDDYFDQYLGLDVHKPIEPLDWLTVPEQKLLATTGGKVFFDSIGLEQVRKNLSYYPTDIWLNDGQRLERYRAGGASDGPSRQRWRRARCSTNCQ